MLTGKNLSYEVNTHSVFKGVDISVSKGDKVGLVGPNGAGKTSLLKLLTKELEPSAGTIINKDLEVGLLPQDLKNWLDVKVYQFLEEVTGVKKAKLDYEIAEKRFNEDSTDSQTLMIYCDAMDRLNTLDVDRFDSRVAKALVDAGLEDSYANRYIGELSGGQQTRVALSAIFSSRYDVVLLDEPTNNLDIEGIVILEKFIQGSNAAFLMVSHDRRFLRNATTRIIELLGGDNGVNQYGLGYDEYKEARENAFLSEQRAYEEHQQSIKELKNAVRTSKIRANSAESKKSKKADGDKLNANFRASRAAGHLGSQAKSQETRLEKLISETPNKPQSPVVLDFMFNSIEVLKKQYLSASEVIVKYDNGTQLGPFNLQLYGGDRVAIVGENGSGKSTLLKSLLGLAPVTSGNLKIAPDSRIGYMDQNQTLPHNDGGLVDNILYLAPQSTKKDAIHLLKKFNFSEEQILGAKAKNLSGGERAKVLLASISANNSNILILDEPTNNLDIPTIDGLQEAISKFPGTILVVSHDREFIDGIGINRTIYI